MITLMLSVSSFSQTNINRELCSDLIPYPVELNLKGDVFSFSESGLISVDSKFRDMIPYVKSQIKEVTDFNMSVSSKSGGVISIIESDQVKESEGYRLDIDSEGVKIYAKDRGGVIYAVQSLKQLIYLNNKPWAAKFIFVPQLSIVDYPAFEWRGFMLDVSRSFHKIEEIKKFVDYMAMLKLNRFHLHLSDDQGFRVEMKKYKKLNEIGSWRVDHVVYDENDNSVWGRPVQKEGELANYGGYYTIEELKDLVAYAKERNIEILPEIDVPGHSQAIIASYPELSCEPDKDFTVATGGVRTNNTICPSTEATYDFIKTLVDELSDIFPFEYIHIGGDECNKAQWARHDQCSEFKKSHSLEGDDELQSYFVHRVEEIVNGAGKKMIGWDEILDGGLAPNATVMSWRGESGGIAAAKMNHNVIMCPSHSNYLDLKQGQSDSEPNLGYARALMKNSYNFKIIPDELAEDQRKYIIGNQANLWTETFAMPKSLWYMALPRLYAVAENVWTPTEVKSWDNFTERLKPHFAWMDFNGVRHAKSVFNPWMYHQGDGSTVKVWFTSQITDPEIRYTLDGSDPTYQSPKYCDTLTISQTTMLKAAIFDGREAIGDVVSRNFSIHKGAGADVKIYSEESPEGVIESSSKFTDLTFGQFLEPGDDAWVTFKEDAKIEVLFDKPTDVQMVSLSSQRHTLSFRYGAKQIIVYGKTADGECRKIGDSGLLESNITAGRNLFTDLVEAKGEQLISIIIEVKREPTVPEGYVPDMVGKPTTLQLDEIVIL